MKSSMNRVFFKALSLVAIFGLVISAGSAQQAHAQEVQKVVVVVNQANNLSSISVSNLSDVFLKEKGSVDGQDLKPINYSLGSPARTLFDKTVHDMSQSNMEQYWNEKKVSGGGTAPSEQGSAAPLLMLLTRSQQAIGYVPASEWSQDQYGSSLKVLDIEKNGNTYGPDSSEYPLKSK